MINAPALILVGASGVGKNTVAEALLSAAESPFFYIRSLCTREKRETFTDEYIYVSEEEFLRRIEKGEMLEHTRYGGHLYGTPMSEIQKAREEGKIPLMILDINGVESIRRNHPDLSVYAVYLYADPIEIRRRLEERDLRMNTAEEREKVRRRLENNRADFRVLAKEKHLLFDTFVENRLVAETANRVLALYREKASVSEEEKLAMLVFFKNAVSFEI